MEVTWRGKMELNNNKKYQKFAQKKLKKYIIGVLMKQMGFNKMTTQDSS
jgi:hypothetical protein